MLAGPCIAPCKRQRIKAKKEISVKDIEIAIEKYLEMVGFRDVDRIREDLTDPRNTFAMYI